jgi:integrase
MTRPLSKTELKQIIDNPKSFLNPRDKTLFFTQLFTGLRGSEVCSITVEQIGKKVRYGWVFNNPITMKKTQMKGKRHSRTAFLSPYLENILKTYLINHYEAFSGVPPTPEKYLFPSLKCQDKPLLCSTWNEILKDIFIRNNIFDVRGKLGTHTLRKTYVVDLYNNKEVRSNPELFKKLTGHTNYNNISFYVGVYVDELKDAQTNVYSQILSETEMGKELQRCQNQLIQEKERQRLCERYSEYEEDIYFE